MTALDEANHGVILDRTAFYPGGGSQPADRGTLALDGSASVTVARAEDRAGRRAPARQDAPLPALGRPSGQIDWDLRSG